MGTSRLPGLIRDNVGTSFPRASIISAAFSGSPVQVNSLTLCFLHISFILSISLFTVSSTPSDSMMSMASMPLMSLSIAFSTTLRLYLSIISHAVSCMPEAMISVTAFPAASRSLKIARASALNSGTD